MSDSEESEEFQEKTSRKDSAASSSIPRTSNLLNCLFKNRDNMNDENDSAMEIEQDDNGGDDYDSSDHSIEDNSTCTEIHPDVLLTMARMANVQPVRFGTPSLPNKQLITMLDTVHEIVKHANDLPETLAANQVETVLDKILLPVLLRAVHEDALHGLEYNKLVICCMYHFLNIFVAKLALGGLPLNQDSYYWKLFHLCTQQNRFFIRTSNYSFNQISRMIPGDIHLRSAIFKRATGLSDWYSSILLWFNKIGGYEIFSTFAGSSLVDALPINEHLMTVEWLIGQSQHFQTEFNQQFVLPAGMPFLDKFMQLPDEELDKSPLDLRDNLYKILYRTARMFVFYNCMDMEDYELSHKLHARFLKLIMRSILQGNFIQKIVGFDELLASLSQQELAEMNEDDFREFIKENEVVESLFKDNLHHMVYIDRLLRTMIILLERGLVDKNVLDIIWEQQLDKHDAILRNVVLVLSKMSLYFSDELFITLFKKLEKSWTDGDEKMRELVLDVMRRLGTELRSSSVEKNDTIRKIIGILWRWSCDMSDSSPDKVYNVILEILQEARGQQPDFTILKDQALHIADWCLDPIHSSTDDTPTASGLILLKKLICLVPEERPFDDDNRQELIRKFDTRFSSDTQSSRRTIFAFGRRIAESICVWIERIATKVRDVPDNAMDTDSSSSESDDPDDLIVINLRKQLEFLHFIIIEGRRVYKDHFNLFESPWLPILWKRMIDRTSHTLQTIGFRFFRDVVVIVLDSNSFASASYESHRVFFYDCVLSVPAVNLTQSGFKCFAMYLKFVNISKGILEYAQSLELDDDEQQFILSDSNFEGEEYLCQVIMNAHNAMQKDASQLLERMYSSYIKLKADEESDKIIVNKCVNWVMDVDKLRGTMKKEESIRMMKNVLQSILEVVEKSENDVKLIVRQRPTLRRSIAIHGFKSDLFFKVEDIHALFPPTLVPKHFNNSWVVCLNDNMLVFEVVQSACRILNSIGADVSPYPMVIQKKLSSSLKASKIPQIDWGSTIKELGISEGWSFTTRLERGKISSNSEMDRSYQNIVNINRCNQRERNLLSYQLADHSSFVVKLLELADESDLLENSYQLLASLPIKREIGLSYQKDYAALLAAIHAQSTVSIRIYLLFYLFECLLPCTSPETKNNSQALRLFYEANGISSLLKLFTRLSTAAEQQLEYEMFCCDILFRLVPGLFQIYLAKNQKADEMEYKTWNKIDPFMDLASRLFSSTSTLPEVEYDLNILLSIVRAGSKFLSNTSGNLFYSAVLEMRCGEDDEALLDEDNDPAEDQADHMVFASVGLLSLLCVNNPERGRELLGNAEFHKFLVDCCNSDSGNDYSNLIPNLFYALEKHLKTDDLIEGLVDYMFSQMENGTSTFWEVITCLIERFYTHHSRPLKRIAEYTSATIQWLIGIQMETEATMSVYGNQHVLSGRLKLATVLLSRQTDQVKEEVGLPAGQDLIQRLLYKFLIPSSKELYDSQHKENGMARSQTTYEASRQSVGVTAVPRSTSCMLPSRVVAVCRSEDSQLEAYKLLVTLASPTDCFLKVVQTICALFYNNRETLIPWDYQPDLTLRMPGNYVGLKNGGATCYMNSILQQLYMIPEFRDTLLNVALLEEPKEDGSYQIKILSALQSVFANLAGSELEAYTPDEFWTIFKMNERIVNVHEQQDAYEFYNKVVDLIDEGMEKVGAQKIGTKIFGGKFADEKICTDCPHRFTREEPFTSISIDVRSHNNIVDSLNEFVRGDVLENDNAYHCEECNKKVRAVKRMTIKSLPDNLVVQLKRFEFDWERNEPVKFNDYFEFPFEIDMKPYTTDAMNSKDDASSGPDCSQDSDIYLYRLKGVVVHSGQATGGHYFSYIRSSDNTWHKFDDTEVSIYPCDPQDVKHKWFGEDPNCSMDSNRRRARVWWNAFVLFYEKTSPIVPTNKTMLTTLSAIPGVPLSLPLTVDPNIPNLDISRRSSTASPVTRLHKRFSTMSLRSRPRYIPPKLEMKVRDMNTRVMHERNEFSYTFCEFMLDLASTYGHASEPFRSKKLMEVVSMFTFYTLIRSAPICRREVSKTFDKEEILPVIETLLQSKSSRIWFINNIVLNEMLSRSYLTHLGNVINETKFAYIKCLLTLIRLCVEKKDTIADLKTDATPFLTTLLSKRRSKSPFVVDLLLESLVVLFREENSDELANLLYIAYSPELAGNYLRAGFLPACLRYLDLNRYWEHPIFGNMLSLSLTLFGSIDFRPLFSRRILDSIRTLDKCPYHVVDNPVLLEDCLDSQEIITLVINVGDKMLKYLDLTVVAHLRDGTVENYQNLLCCLCWNNLTMTQKLLNILFRYINAKNTSDEYFQPLLSILYAIVNVKDSVYKSRKLLLWLLKEYHLQGDLFRASSPDTKFSCVPLMKSQENRRRFLEALIIILEAYDTHSGREDDPNVVEFMEHEHITDFFYQFRQYWDEIKENLRTIPSLSVEERRMYAEQAESLQRIIIICRDDDENVSDEEGSDYSENQAMDMDEDVTESGDEQPLDLTLSTAASRSSVTTPMLAEKRTHIQEDFDPPTEPAEPKKSRLSDNGEEDPDRMLLNLLNSSTSAGDFNPKPMQPPPSYPDDSQA